MAIGDYGAVLGDMEVLFAAGTAAGLTDVQLLERFLSDGRAAGEAAFAALVQRHGPMVLRVCRGELGELHAAEDASQATFLILARQARSIRDRASLASWLYGVARRVARRARLDRARRVARERRRALMAEERARHAPEPPELIPEIQEELDRLPERYRPPIVLCDMEGRTHEEAARQLRIPVGTVKTRLSRGRDRLRGRLVRRGLAPAMVASTLGAPARAGIPAPLLNATVQAAMRVAAFRAAGVSASVAALVQGVLRAMLIHKIQTAAVLAAASMILVVASLAAVSALSTPARSAQEPQPRRVPGAPPKPDASDPRDSQPIEVEVAVVKKGEFRRTTHQPGSVEPSQRVDVLPTASGFVKRIAVDIGSAVKRGDVLAEIEAPELAIEIARTRASVERARARLLAAESKTQAAELAVKTALAILESSEAALRAAETRAVYRKKQLQRIRELVERGSVEHRLLDEEEDRSRAADDAVLATRFQVGVSRAAVEEARGKIETARADVGEEQASLRLAKLELQKAELMASAPRIISPIGGIVTRRVCNVGEFVRAAGVGGAGSLFTIMETRSVRIVTNVPDADVPAVDVGDPAVFHANAFGGREYRGKVSRIAGIEEPNGTMRVEIDLDNADGRLRPGMYGRVEIQLEPPVPALSIPASAVGSGTGPSYFCYRVIHGRAVSTPIRVRAADGQYAAVEGLREGDAVVADPTRSGIREGRAIKPIPRSAPPTQ